MTKPELAAHVRTMNFFGADLKMRSGQWEGDCVFCGKEGHFYAAVKDSLWDCKVCGESGNQVTFLEKVYKAARAETTEAAWAKLVASRGIPVEVLRRHLAFAGDRWMIPGVAANGRMRDLRLYDYQQLISAAGCESQLWGAEKLAKSKPSARVALCEGEWDGMAMEWLLEQAGILESWVVVAVPGASVLKDEWVSLFDGRDVVALYDNDEAGDRGAERAQDKLGKHAKKMCFVHWPRALETGYDLRDFVRGAFAKEQDAQEALRELLDICRPEPRTRRAKGGEHPDEEAVDDVPDFSALVEVFSREIRMSRDMVDCLCLMMATALSNDIQGDPLWLYLVGPPGTGKTLLLASLATSSRCLMRSTVTPHSLVSGWRGEAEKDPSLIPRLAGLTLVAKDFTEILTMPQMIQDEVFSTLRGAYDGFVSKSFGNGITREFKDCRFSLLAGVTSAIHACRTASLGERFLKFQFKRPAREHAEPAIHASIASVGTESKIETTLSAAVDSFLTRTLTPETLPTLPDRYIDKLTALVQLIAMLRAQVSRDNRSGDVLYRPEPEAGTRLAKQLAKLSRMVAFVLGRDEVDDPCYALAERVAFDTAYGFHLDVVDAMMRVGGRATRDVMRKAADVSAATIGRYCEDLCMLGVIRDTGEKTDVTQGRPSAIYSVTQKLAELWKRARGENAWTPRLKRSPPSRRRLVLRRG